MESKQAERQEHAARRIAERLELIAKRCNAMEYWQLDEVIIAIDELQEKWSGA
jgi:hypothetical protein